MHLCHLSLNIQFSKLEMLSVSWDFPFQVIGAINNAKDELGPWSLDYVRKNYLSSSWIIDGLNHPGEINSFVSEVIMFLFLLIYKVTPRSWNKIACIDFVAFVIYS